MKLAIDEHLHECEKCHNYYPHKGFNCKKFFKWGLCEKEESKK
jgi:predicted anti-sigma-YlaC factor YlaD